MNELHILETINWAAGLIMLAFCIWAALDRRVQTRLVGTLALTAGAAFGGLNIIQPNALAFMGHQWQVLLNVSLAVLAVWFFFHWRRLHLTGRRWSDKT